MPVIDQWFTLATAGETVDGREIGEDQLRGMAENYNTDYYTAVIDADHELDFYGAYGHVTEVRLGQKVGRLSLEGKLNANYRLMEMNRMGQRLWFSVWPRQVEGKWYLFRLAVTDNPASIGTDMMKFSALPDGEKPLFTAPKPLEFPTENDDSQEQPPGWFTSFMHRFTSNGPKTEQEDDNMTPEQFSAMTDQNKTLTDAITEQTKAFNALAEVLKKEPQEAEETADKQTPPEDEGNQFSMAALVQKLDDLNSKFEALKNTPAGSTLVPDHTGGADGEKEFV